ncbi:MAG TPA: HEAT repeat domain-containing protein [Pirellulales bacterium]|jgi:HEAT repeat protein|nr:HEAT repeat domain-containing protein [Pirellulales bacterium]
MKSFIAFASVGLIWISLAVAPVHAQLPAYSGGSASQWYSANDEGSIRVATLVAKALAQTLYDPNIDVRQAAIGALEAMEVNAAPVVADIAQRLRDVDAYLRADASRTLTKLNTVAVPSVIAALQDRDPRVRELAARTFIEMKTVPTDAIHPLIQLLWDCNTDVRQAAIEALEAMGPAAKPAMEALVQRMRDPDAYLRSDASRTLVKFGPDSLTSLLPLLNDGDPRVRELAARTVEEIEFNVTSGNYVTADTR